MLKPGDSVSEFDVRTADGSRVSYDCLWQRRNLLLIALPQSDVAARDEYVRALSARMSELTAYDTACVITSDSIMGIDPPSAIVADRWGEIHHVAAAPRVADLPGADDLIEWLRFVQFQCPECQGETR